MSISYRVISIGALSRHALRGEKEPKRIPHATTSLIRDGETTILVDPSLPAEMLAHRLDERVGLTPDKIDVVFLTNFRPVHRRGLDLFERARWLMYEEEIAAMAAHLDETGRRSAESKDVLELVRAERSLLERVAPAPERLTRGVHLYPAAGVTPGSAGLLLALPARTVVVAGDVVLTQEHYEAGQLPEQVADLDEARKSFSEIVEIADEIIPGHDNVFRAMGR